MDTLNVLMDIRPGCSVGMDPETDETQISNVIWCDPKAYTQEEFDGLDAQLSHAARSRHFSVDGFGGTDHGNRGLLGLAVCVVRIDTKHQLGAVAR